MNINREKKQCQTIKASTILPPLSLISIPITMLPYLFVKLLVYAKNLVHTESMERKVVLITGAASGIGEELAYEYAKRGARLSLIDIRKENLVTVADMARSLGSPDVTIIGADVSKVEDSKRFIDETMKHFGRLDHLVNNAGVSGIPILIEDIHDLTKYNPIMDTNFWGAVHGTLYAIPHLKNSKGRIIVVASGCGWFPLPRLSIYNVNIDISSFQFYFNLLFNLFMSQNNSLTLWYQASKAATISFFETLRIELGWSIGITIVTPGFIKTNMALKAYEEEASLQWIPLGSANECAKDIVKSACRGDMYVTNPSWLKAVFPSKLLFPELVDWAERHIFGLWQKPSCKNGDLRMSKNNQALKTE
ncbi:putative oxidoreductase [Medicago truncatula]|uniref:Putative oxidoreductase n=1 Tax=Medicago truncatula TaxID=3880 RepID=A0A396GXC7_MEDTR|nr:putative oxidoreductase [Medicago truncatula]